VPIQTAPRLSSKITRGSKSSAGAETFATSCGSPVPSYFNNRKPAQIHIPLFRPAPIRVSESGKFNRTSNLPPRKMPTRRALANHNCPLASLATEEYPPAGNPSCVENIFTAPSLIRPRPPLE
jgi:hypothetical protein